MLKRAFRVGSILGVGSILAGLPVLASGQPVVGPYVSLGGGVDLQQNETVVPAPSLGIPNKVIYKFHPGFAARVSAGYGLGNGLRLEIEGDYASNVVRGAAGITNAGLNPPRRAGGFERRYGGFLNVLYDVDLGLPIYPYVGVGAGGLQIEHNRFNQNIQGAVIVPPPVLPGAPPLGFHDQTIGGFAYQGIAGFSVPIPGVTGLSFTADYHFVGLLDPLPAFELVRRENILVVPTGPGPHPFNATLKPVNVAGNRRFANDFNHEITLGFRYALFQPRPPMPPPAEQAAPVPNAPAAKTYLVFFDWDRADLTERARQIVGQAAQASQQGGTTRIEVNGYTDLSGTPAYNQRLSVRRATTVKAELVRDGVQASEIATSGLGESNPLVPTARGVREPQNRRVEILLR